MNISILGTRGIPNNYGGFEECAEMISQYFFKKGHKVTVYVPDDHNYKEKNWKGICLARFFSKEKYLKSFSTMIFDYLSLRNAIKQDYDIILELGYNPSGFFLPIFSKKKGNAVIITNMDGLEWKRSKWSKLIKEFSRICEKRAAIYSDYIIADNVEIKNYLQETYDKDAVFIPYGADIVDDFDKEVLINYWVKENHYYILIARLEPENSIKTILDGFRISGSKAPFLVIGNHTTKYGQYLLKKYTDKDIRFLGAIYDYSVLSVLRHYSRIYFHGHSVGGTNPSLLEAMASGAKIVAHENRFNRSVLGENSLYFRDHHDVARIIKDFYSLYRYEFMERNIEKVLCVYNWEIVCERYLELFKIALERRSK